MSAASLGTLAVIVSIKDVDVLSTIALALAVLAFAAQLIVSLAQAQGSAQQLSQTERINSQTQSTLAEVRSTAHALLTNQSDQFNKVLAAALRTVTESAVREVAEATGDTNASDGSTNQLRALDPTEIAVEVERRLRGALTLAPAKSSPLSEPTWLNDPLDEVSGPATMQLFRSLTHNALDYFINLSRSGRFQSTKQVYVYASSSATRELFDAGVLKNGGLSRSRKHYDASVTG
ncbi:hypothetical protein [Micromonospora sp. NPDC049240]|uniref:hypothetical protein n=1 Tax=Micromonospora sp. NPDC049240 TaxID=3155151 RepID=UPI00340B2F41